MNNSAKKTGMYSPWEVFHNQIKALLHQDLAHEIFGDVHGVFFCTDTE